MIPGHCRAFRLLPFCFSTFRQVMCANKGIICGQWGVEWSHTWSEFVREPYICDGKLEFIFKVNLKCYRACFYSIVNFYSFIIQYINVNLNQCYTDERGNGMNLHSGGSYCYCSKNK